MLYEEDKLEITEKIRPDLRIECHGVGGTSDSSTGLDTGAELNKGH